MKYSSGTIRTKFTDLINSITPDDVARSPGDFTRKRLCPLNHTLMLLLSMEGHSLNTEIGNYFNTMGLRPPSKSAFCQQRNKLSPEALPDLFAATNSLFPFEKTYKGLHLLAVDGSSLNIPSLPDDAETFIPYNSNNGGYHQFHLNAVYDLLEDRYLDAITVPRRKFNEQRDFCKLVDRNPLRNEPCLFIADRGYFCYNTIAYVICAGQYFLIRAKEPESHGSILGGIDFPQKDEFDVDRTFILSRKAENASDSNVYKRLRKDHRFDFIPPEDHVSTFVMDLRIVKVITADDSYEYIVTNLPRERFHAASIKWLYNARWGIESSFKKLKYNLALAYFHSYKREFIDQEIFARLIMYNIISLLIRTVRVRKGDTKYAYNISFADAVANCRRFLLTKMTATKLKYLLLMSLTPIRPGRSSPRKVRSQRLKTLNNRY